MYWHWYNIYSWNENEMQFDICSISTVSIWYTEGKFTLHIYQTGGFDSFFVFLAVFNSRYISFEKRCLILKCETKKKQKQKQIEIHGLSKKSKSSSKYDYNFIKFIILIKKNTTIVSKRIEKYNRTEWLKSKNMGKFYALSIPRYFIKWN